MSRVFERRTLWRLDQADFESAAERLAEAVAAEGMPHLVMGIARGGVHLARVLASQLGLTSVAVRAQHNASDDTYLQAGGHVEVDAADVRRAYLTSGSHVLLADDICGSGATLTAVAVALARTVRPITVTTCTLCRNEGSSRSPDLWMWDVRDWVVFPWEAPSPPGTTPLPPPDSVRRAAR